MKTFLGILVVAVVVQTSCFAQLIQITRFDRNGTLGWVNPLCTTFPIYEVLRADSVTGPWGHAAYVTNSTTYQLPVTVPNGSAAFYRIVWTNDVPVTFDYVYYEDDFPAIIGELTLNFASLQASWFFEDTGLSSGVHPEGAGSAAIGFTPDLRTWGIVIQPNLDDTVFIAGSLQSSSTGSGCEYTAYVGLVFQSTIAGTEQIGDFVALRQ